MHRLFFATSFSSVNDNSAPGHFGPRRRRLRLLLLLRSTSAVSVARAKSETAFVAATAAPSIDLCYRHAPALGIETRPECPAQTFNTVFSYRDVIIKRLCYNIFESIGDHRFILHSTATHPAVPAPAPFASPQAVSNQYDVLRHIADKLRDAARRGGPAIALEDATPELRELRGTEGIGWTLVPMRFLFGVFHAAGPGHGKAV